MSEISVTRLSGSVSSWMALGMVLLVGWDPSDASAQDKGLEVLNQAAVRYRDVETLCADFTQHLYVPLLGGEHTGTGRCVKLSRTFLRCVLITRKGSHRGRRDVCVGVFPE